EGRYDRRDRSVAPDGPRRQLPHQPLPLLLHGGPTDRRDQEVHRLDAQPRRPEDRQRHRLLPPAEVTSMNGSTTAQATAPTAFVEPSPLTRKPRRVKRMAEIVLRVVALTSIASIILILVFVAREALPILFDEKVRNEVTPQSMMGPVALADGSTGFA